MSTKNTEMSKPKKNKNKRTKNKTENPIKQGVLNKPNIR